MRYGAGWINYSYIRQYFIILNCYYLKFAAKSELILGTVIYGLLTINWISFFKNFNYFFDYIVLPILFYVQQF